MILLIPSGSWMFVLQIIYGQNGQNGQFTIQPSVVSTLRDEFPPINNN